MLGTSISTALNEQIAKEMYASHLYLAMSAYFHTLNLNGFAHWMRLQSSEETGHAMKMFDYIVSRGGHVALAEVAKPPANFKTALNALEGVLAHEQKVTASIHKLYAMAEKEKDYATVVMLQWFVAEQVEEEATANEIVERVKMISDKPGALLYIDKELKKRGGKA